MQTLKILEQIAVIREYTIRLLDGKTSAKEVQSEIELLTDMLLARDKANETRSGISSIKRGTVESSLPVEDEEDTSTLSTDNRLFINQNGVLLFEVERNKKGIAFQESNGYVIFVPHKDTKLLKPATSVKDNAGLLWTLSPTDNEFVVVAENEIGDVIIGMKKVQDLINGTETMEGSL